MTTTTKTRYWTFVLYPDSAPDNWLDYLKDTHLPIAISPIHNKDINPDNTLKKPHYHVIVAFDGPTTYKNIVDNFTDFLNCPIPKRVMSLRGMYRYLCHLDNPEKFQYDVNDIIHLNDFNIEMSESDIIIVIKQIIDVININGIRNYRELFDYYINEGFFDELKVIKANAFFFKTYLSCKN